MAVLSREIVPETVTALPVSPPELPPEEPPDELPVVDVLTAGELPQPRELKGKVAANNSMKIKNLFRMVSLGFPALKRSQESHIVRAGFTAFDRDGGWR